jgi:MYXO-CTERM domain-containing protein
VGHMLFGWPDLYGFGNYCIMGNGSSQKNPVGINDFYRADQGWIPVIDVTKDTNALFKADVNGAGYRYTNPKNSKESFFWSNVQSSDRFSTISGDGLLFLHFDKNIGSNNPPNPLSLAVVQADGKKDLDQTMWPSPGSDANDFFHGGGVSEFSGAKFTTSKWNDGTASELRVYEVAAISPSMQFKVGNGPIVEMPSGGAGGTGGTNSAGGSGGQTPLGGAAGMSAGGGIAGTAAGGTSTGGGVATAGAGMASGGSGLTTAGASTSGGASAPTTPPSEGASCSCRVHGGGAGRGLVSVLLVAGFAALRRRRRGV